jgi:hypothetical protein
MDLFLGGVEPPESDIFITIAVYVSYSRNRGYDNIDLLTD